MSLFMFEVSVRGWGKHLAGEIQACFGLMQVRVVLCCLSFFSCLWEMHLHLNSHQELQMHLTNVHDLPAQLTHTCLWLLSVQFRCNRFTQGLSGNISGRGNTAHTIKITTGIPAIQMWFLLALCCWSCELANIKARWLHVKTRAEQSCFQPCLL